MAPPTQNRWTRVTAHNGGEKPRRPSSLTELCKAANETPASKRRETSPLPFPLHQYTLRVMEYLMLHPKKVISKTELTEHIYDQDFDLDSNVIEVFVGRLRKKLDPNNTLKPIETLRGRGYRLSQSLTGE